MSTLILVALNVILSACGDATGKLWAISANNRWLIVSLLINTLTQITFAFVIRNSGLAVGGAMLLLFVLLTNIFVGYVLFAEEIGVNQWTGICLGVIAILFIANALKVPA